ncbi:hypothetical protein BDQ17DRAFT_1426422 [Cyathus striatus]|nr:hypothetical protein BDQ17DRAFT_1426422 [Cyathus striatus]
MSGPVTAVTKLNNYLQKNQNICAVSYVETSAPVGPGLNPVWTIQCKLDGKVRGEGTSTVSKTLAKNAAASQALRYLNVL